MSILVTHNLYHEIKPEDFDRFYITKHMTPEQRVAICAEKVRISTLQGAAILLNTDYGIRSFLYRRSFEKSFTQLPLLGLHARFEEAITDEQLSTLCLLYEAADQLIFNPTMILSYAEGGTGKPIHQSVPVNRRLFSYPPKAPPPKLQGFEQYQEKEDITPPKITDYFQVYHALSDQNQERADRLLQTFFNFTASELAQMKEALQNETPPSERLFYAFPIPLGNPEKWSPSYVKTYELLRKWKPVIDEPGTLDLVQTHPSLRPRELFILPSFTMSQIALRIKYGEHAATYQGVLGKVTPLTIEAFKKLHLRVKGLGMPLAPLPHEADGEKTGGQIIFSFHDDYHAERDSLIRNNEKEALLQINRVFRNALAANPSDKNSGLYKKINWSLVDGELHNSVTAKQKFGAIFYLISLWNEDAKRLIITDMVFRGAVWKGFHVTRDDLFAPEQQIYDEIRRKFTHIAKVKNITFINPITPEQYDQIKKYDVTRRVTSL